MGVIYRSYEQIEKVHGQNKHPCTIMTKNDVAEDVDLLRLLFDYIMTRHVKKNC